MGKANGSFDIMQGLGCRMQGNGTTESSMKAIWVSGLGILGSGVAVGA